MESYKNESINMYENVFKCSIDALQKWWWDAKKSHHKLGYKWFNIMIQGAPLLKENGLSDKPMFFW
jgi:hypothetical protein